MQAGLTIGVDEEDGSMFAEIDDCTGGSGFVRSPNRCSAFADLAPLVLEHLRYAGVVKPECKISST